MGGWREAEEKHENGASARALAKGRTRLVIKGRRREHEGKENKTVAKELIKGGVEEVKTGVQAVSVNKCISERADEPGNKGEGKEK